MNGVCPQFFGVCPQKDCGEGVGWQGRREGGEWGDNDARVWGQTPGLDGGDGLEANPEGGFVAVELRRELEDADVFPCEDAKVVLQPVRRGDAWCHCEYDAVVGECQREEGVRRAGKRRNADAPSPAGIPSGGCE